MNIIILPHYSIDNIFSFPEKNGFNHQPCYLNGLFFLPGSFCFHTTITTHKDTQ